MTAKAGDVGGLLSALLAFQKDAPHIPLDSTNPHFRSKFASLPDVLKIVRPKLTECGLVWTAKPSQDDEGRPVLKYKLAHAPSGEVEEGEMPLLLVKQDPQAQGSAITYARRYALLSVLNLVGDADDDGNRATEPKAETPVPEPPPVLTEKGRQKVIDAFSKAGIEGADFDLYLSAVGLSDVEQMTPGHAAKLREKLDDWLAKNPVAA